MYQCLSMIIGICRGFILPREKREEWTRRLYVVNRARSFGGFS